MSTISASTTTTTAYKVTADTTGTLVLQTGATPTTAVTIDGSQNVGIGVTPTTLTAAANSLQVYGGASQARIALQNATTGSTATSGFHLCAIGSRAVIDQRSNSSLEFTINANEVARFDTSGNLLVARTSSYGVNYKIQAGNSTGNPWFVVQDNGTSSNVGMYCGSATAHQISTAATASTSNTIIEFGRSATGTGSYTACGKLWLDGSGNFAAANSSDVRFKENIIDLPNGLATVMALKPRQFDWIGDEARKQVKGFVAQEVEEVLPRSVGEDKDGYKLISMETELFPILVAAIQEQQAIIQQLTARIETLEAK